MVPFDRSGGENPCSQPKCPIHSNLTNRTILALSCLHPFKRFFNARRVLSGVELVHKIIKGQFGLPDSFGTDPFQAFQQN